MNATRIATKNSRETLNEVQRFAGLALSINSLMAALKIGVGLLSGSHALLASALYSINDVFSSIAIAVSIRIGFRKPSDEYPFGHGKAEFIASGMVSLTIAIGVFFMFFFSVIDILKGVPGPPHALALTLATLSLIVSWRLSRKGHHIAKKLQSPALNTCVAHHHADAEGSLLALIGISGAVLGFHVLDRVIAVFETLHLIALSGTLLGKSVKGLMDRAIPDEDIDMVRIACREVTDVGEITFLRSRRAGRFTYVDVGVALPNETHVSRAHALREQLEDAVKGVLGPSVSAQIRFQGHGFPEPQVRSGGSQHG